MLSTLHQNIPDSLPPCAIEAEEAILGGILLDPNAYGRVSHLLEPEHFYISSHQKIYAACQAMAKANEQINLMTVCQWLSDKRKLDSIGGTSKLAQMVDRTVSAVNIDRMARLVREKFCRRQLIEFSHTLQRVGYASEVSLDVSAKQIKNSLAELLEPFIEDPMEREYQRYKKLLAQIEELELRPGDPGFKAFQFHQLAERSGRSVSQLKELFYKSLLSEEDEPPCSLAELRQRYGGEFREWLLHGLFPAGSTTLIHSLGGVGKTRLAYDLAYHFCTGEDWNGFPMNGSGSVLIVQTDEQPVDLLDNLESRGFTDSHAVTVKMKWHVDFIANLYREVERIQPKLIIIDSLASISAGSVSENDTEFARPILLLNKIARDSGAHILLLHHSSKLRENGKGQARGSTAIFNAVSQVWQLTKDSTRAPDCTERLLLIEKSRCRRPATYQLEYNPDDRGWICYGEVGEDDSEKPMKERIIEFLRANPGTPYQNSEIQEAVGGNINSIRKIVSRLAMDGLVNSKRSKFSSARCYWLGAIAGGSLADQSGWITYEATEASEIQPQVIHSTEKISEKTSATSEKIPEQWISEAEKVTESPTQQEIGEVIHPSDPQLIHLRSEVDRALDEDEDIPSETVEKFRAVVSRAFVALPFTAEEKRHILECNCLDRQTKPIADLSPLELVGLAEDIITELGEQPAPAQYGLAVNDIVRYVGNNAQRAGIFEMASDKGFPVRVAQTLDNDRALLKSRAWHIEVEYLLSDIKKVTK